MADEVICLSSSDDEFQLKAGFRTNKGPERQTPNRIRKRKIVEEVEVSTAKRRIHSVKIETFKKRRISTDDGIEEVKEIPKASKSQSHQEKTSPKKFSSTDLSLPSTSKAGLSNERVRHGPKLLIKEKRPMDENNGPTEVFSQFLSLCLSKDRSPDMKKIIEKLKRRYEQTDPAYVHCPAFIGLLNEKRDFLMNDSNLYIHIREIDSEMKCRKRDVVHPKEEGKVEKAEAEETNAESNRNDSRIRLLMKAMEKCEKRIKELSEAEVDWDDDEDSSYMKLAKYEDKMIQMYSKICELTGGDHDAGRRYLRPKHLKVTGIAEVDQAIISFINKRLKNKRKRSQRALSVDCVIFPDYCDILNCIEACNKQRDLGMEKKKMEKIAQKAFTDLGNYLQKVRRDDLVDSFSLVLANSSDPARENPELLRKLEESKNEGKKKLNAIFEKYVRLQEEGPAREDENESDSDPEEDKDDEQEDEDSSEEKNDEVDSEDPVDSNKNVPINTCSNGESLKKSPCNGYSGKDLRATGYVSDSADTVILPTTRDNKRPGEKMLTPSVPAVTRKLQAQISNEKIAAKRVYKPGPKFTKPIIKPLIKNIENVRVVIRPDDAVNLNVFNQGVISNEVLASSTNDEEDDTVANNSKTSETSPEVPDDEMSNEQNNDEIIDKNVQPSINNTSIKNVSVQNEAISTVSKTDSVLKSVTEPTKELDDFIPPESNVEKSPPRKVTSLDNPEITSSTGAIEDGKKSEIIAGDIEDEIHGEDDIVVVDNSSFPDSTLQRADIKKTEDTKEINQSKFDSQPVLKLREFAKPPEFWKNTPDKNPETRKKTIAANVQPIECIDVETDTVQTDTSSSIAGTSLSSNRLSVMKKSKSISIVGTSKQGSKFVRLTPIDGIKTKIIETSRQKILSLLLTKSIISHFSGMPVRTRPLHNATVGSSNVAQPNQNPRFINPVHRIRNNLVVRTPDKRVNPVTIKKIMQKHQ
ncbi:uncharacterized protein [Fopius arisanus]|uniref:Uncharacterized protein isoform X1 n=1 Tax=Fopius arisanus TaxID=64838 RepID=A0A9R1TRQ0_9HYME|nr:PREDICTED: uncharacterized protein LOC105273392 isoform X1 [Fopius arisanus]